MGMFPLRTADALSKSAQTDESISEAYIPYDRNYLIRKVSTAEFVLARENQMEQVVIVPS
jgi:hypothetical protein